MAVYDDVKRALQDIMAPQLAEMRGETRTGFAELRAEMDRRFAEVDKKFFAFDSKLSELRSEMAQLRAEMRQDTNNLHTDLVRIEQIMEARLTTLGVVERITRIEERMGIKPAPAG